MAKAPKVAPKSAPAEKKPTKAEQREEKLMTALKELGAGKHKIAAALKEKKIKGEVGDAERCPIALYVKKLFPKANVNVDCDSITLAFSDGQDVDIKPPKAISNFIETFDGTEEDTDNGYPELSK
jgi:hypothetical protein